MLEYHPTDAFPGGDRTGGKVDELTPPLHQDLFNTMLPLCVVWAPRLLKIRGVTWIALLLLYPIYALAAEQHPAFTTPESAGPDFAVQGEYRGIVGHTLPIGAQVVALGARGESHC